MASKRDRAGSVQEPPPKPGDTRAVTAPAESPHAAACRAIDAARQQAEATDPLPDGPQPAGPPTCRVCKRQKLPIAMDAIAGPYCDATCYAYRWPPTPPTVAEWHAHEQRQAGPEKR